MKKCKYSKCENKIKEHKRIMFCSRQCWKLYNKVIKIKKCAQESCHNTFEVINGAKQFCSIECRKKKAAEPKDRPSVSSIKRGFDYDYLFVFSSDIKDWISSQKQSRYAATKKQESSSMKKHEEVFSENENISIFEEVQRAG